MKFLEEIITGFSQETLDKFKNSIKNKGGNNQGREIEIIDYIAYAKPKETNNQNAYHSNRKRLTGKLIDFIYQNDISTKNSNHSIIHKWIETALFLFKNGNTKPAWYLLVKAEHLAIDKELFHDLHKTYLMQIECINCDEAPPLPKILQKLNDTKELKEIEERTIIGSKWIEVELQKIRLTNDGTQFQSVLNKVTKDLKLDTTLMSHPKFALQFLSISRNEAKAQKTYYQFCPFVIQTFNTIKFDKNYLNLKTEILYMVCHALYRTRNFDQLEFYISQFENSILASNNKHLEPKLTMLKGFHYCYTNRLDDAISLLETQSNNSSSINNVIVNLNLALFHFLNNNPSEALRFNRKVNHSDKWFEKKLGKEWVMKKHLMEIIIHVDMENIELVDSLIRSFQTKFKELLKSNKYTRVTPFIKFIRKQTDYKSVNLSQIEDSFTSIPKDEEDLQAMMFYCWLKSKATKKDFYTTLLETI